MRYRAGASTHRFDSSLCPGVCWAQQRPCEYHRGKAAAIRWHLCPNDLAEFTKLALEPQLVNMVFSRSQVHHHVSVQHLWPGWHMHQLDHRRAYC
eukprot:5124487-Prymnesium_polylepis.1